MANPELGAAPAGGGAGRQLVVCCDGTNNTLTGGSADTNVLRLHAHLVAHARPDRVLFYDPGVGVPDAAPPTDPVDWLKRSWSRVAGLASGRGVYDNIADGYLFLVRHWRSADDEIFCFGFSRGAFTARCIVGMVNLFGIIKPEHEVMLPTLVHIYFSLPQGDRRWLQRATLAVHRFTAQPGKAAAELGGHSESDDRKRLAQQVRDLFCTPAGAVAAVHWVGVWDTVESVGMPGPLSRSNPSTATLVTKRVRNVRHALALDEHRWTFSPRLYEEPDDLPVPGQPGSPFPQTLKQRWFSGDHCDVGGSHANGESALSNHAFAWMFNEAAPALGLATLDPVNPFGNAPPAASLRHDTLYETPGWALAGMCPRDMRPRTSDVPPQDIAIHLDPGPRSDADASVWDARRGWIGPLVALVLAGLFLVASGVCLLGAPDAWNPERVLALLAETRHLAMVQLGVLTPGGLAAAKAAILGSAQLPGWAMFWDIAFIGAYGYLLARIASRAFTWLAGASTAGQRRPWWRVLGMVPLLAVGGDVVEDLGTLLALACSGMSIRWLAAVLLVVGALGSVAKWIGLAGCGVLVATRLWMVVGGGSKIGAVRARRPAGASVGATSEAHGQRASS